MHFLVKKETFGFGTTILQCQIIQIIRITGLSDARLQEFCCDIYIVFSGAVVAREYGLPCVVGCQNATRIFSTGLYASMAHP